MFNNKIFKTLIYIVLFLIIIILLSKIGFFGQNSKKIMAVVLIPLLTGGFLYYILRPLVRYIDSFINNRVFTIIISYIIIIILISVLVYFSGHIVQRQVQNLINQSSNYYELAGENIDKLLENSFLKKINFKEKLALFTDKIFKNIENNIVQLFSTLTNIGTILVLIPFVLFYFLKDDRVIFLNIIKLFPVKKRSSVRKLLQAIDKDLQIYIGGRLIVAVLLGLLVFLGYLSIKLPNALILSIIAAITSLVPIIGTIIGILPAIFIALTESLYLTLKVIIVMIIVQQLEGNVIQPNIQGGRLNIHPLIVIFSVIVFILIFGFLGALFAVPAYVVVRVIIKYLRGNISEIT